MSAGHTELLPCPFCGHAAKLEKQQYAHPPHHWVKCEFCAATSTSYSYPKFAIAAWNTRAVSAAEGDLLGLALEAITRARNFIAQTPAYKSQGHTGAHQIVTDLGAILSQAQEMAK